MLHSAVGCHSRIDPDVKKVLEDKTPLIVAIYKWDVFAGKLLLHHDGADLGVQDSK